MTRYRCRLRPVVHGIAPLALGVLLAPIPALPAGAQDVALSDIRQVMSIAADSIATRLRAIGRAHLYLVPTVACDSAAICTPEVLNLSRDAFANSAFATVSQPGRRWPTLCDNSDDIRINAPIFSVDSARLYVVSTHALRRTAQQEGMVHSLVLIRGGGRWNVAVYDTTTVDAPPLDAQDAFRCAWSPEPGAAVSVADRIDVLDRVAGGPAVEIDTEESCPWCRITSSPRLRLGSPTDAQLPRERSPVWSGGRRRYFAQNSTGTQLLAYDSTGALADVIGEAGTQPGAFGDITKVVTDAQDSVFVLDNQRRRIVVLTPSLEFARHVNLPWRVTDFLLLRDGRIMTVRTPRAGDDPVSIHTSSGEIIRTFGAATEPDGTPCSDCGGTLIALAPSGYRVWLARGGRYQLEEWDLTGRRVALLVNPKRSFANQPSNSMFPGAGVVAVAPDSSTAPGMKNLLVTGDGSLWVGFIVVDPLAGLVNVVDVMDPVRARLVKSFVGNSIGTVLQEGIRAAYRTDEFGFPEVRLERYQIDRRR